MREAFQTILYQPIFNLFVGFYDLIPDIGVAILLLTVVIKLILYPLTAKSLQAQQSLSSLRPKLEEIKKQHAGNQQMIAQETMKIYKEHKVNPLGSCLPILVQLPVFIALYWVLQAGLGTSDFSLLYPFVPNPGAMSTITLGIADLGKRSIILAVLAGIAQYFQAKQMTRKRPPPAAGTGGKDEDMAAMMNKQMLYMMPALTVIIGFQLPAGLSLYWLLSTVLTIGQQKLMEKKSPAHAPPSQTT
jgi:YidC/Oxa1 family membrane protein insertase